MAAPDLTTTTLVKSFAGITAATDDDLIGELVTGVSQQFESETGRTLAQVTAVETIYRAPQQSPILVLDEWPNATLVVTENGNALVLDTDYELRDTRRLVRISGTSDINWASHGKISVTAHEGYAAIPADLGLAAREQTLFVFQQTGPGGKRAGTVSKSSPTGGNEAFAEYDFLPTVQRVLRRYTRDFA